MEMRASALLDSFRRMVERTPPPSFHGSCMSSSAYWNWRVLSIFVEMGKAAGEYTVLPSRLEFNRKTHRITTKPEAGGSDASRMPHACTVSWVRDRVFSLEEYERGATGPVAAFECAWGSRNPYHVRKGRLNWADVRTIMGTFGKLAFTKAPLKVMAFTTRQIQDSEGDNWAFLLNLMKAQARALFRYYPIEEEYLFLSWHYGAPILTAFRAEIFKTTLGSG